MPRLGKMMTMRAIMFGFLVVAMLAAGCGDDDDDAATPTTTPAVSDEAAATATGDFEVVFDGEACTVSGPESGPAGVSTFVLTDTRESANVAVYALDDGCTYADVVNYLEEAGGDGAPVPRPDWASSVLRDFQAPALELAENQTQFDYVLEAGPHGILVTRWHGGAGLWGCAGFDAT